jgi:hypothetical protein
MAESTTQAMSHNEVADADSDIADADPSPKTMASVGRSASVIDRTCRVFAPPASSPVDYEVRKSRSLASESGKRGRDARGSRYVATSKRSLNGA